MNLTSKFILSVSTALYLLSFPAMAMERLEFKKSAIPAKPAGAGAGSAAGSGGGSDDEAMEPASTVGKKRAHSPDREEDIRNAKRPKTSGLGLGEDGDEFDSEPPAKKRILSPDRQEAIQEAINRKISGLTHGAHGYNKDSAAARKFNDELVAKGDIEAINRKIEGLEEGRYGYEKDREAARKLKESIIKRYC